MGRVIANAVRDFTGFNNCDLAAEQICDATGQKIIVTDQSQKRDLPVIQKYCACGCGRIVTGRAKTYDATCRKRLSRLNKG